LACPPKPERAKAGPRKRDRKTARKHLPNKAQAAGADKFCCRNGKTAGKEACREGLHSMVGGERSAKHKPVGAAFMKPEKIR
jgi:isopentenyl diphosphate isomerase/L-lactate dehydrogenase-like FMN-dependent dehydrogenase